MNLKQITSKLSHINKQHLIPSLIKAAEKGYCVAVDFDGTLCRNKFPDIGTERKDIVRQVLLLQETGVETILWTCRSDQKLEDAVKWCDKRGLKFTAINSNTPSRMKEYGNDPRKVGADEYWDDKAVRI